MEDWIVWSGHRYRMILVPVRRVESYDRQILKRMGAETLEARDKVEAVMELEPFPIHPFSCQDTEGRLCIDY